MTHDWIWKTRCAETGYLVGECQCCFCDQEPELDEYLFELDHVLEEDFWLDEENLDWTGLEYDEIEDQDEEESFWDTNK